MTNTTLSEAYKDNPIQHIIPIDFNSANAVPESHLWPQSKEVLPDIKPQINEQFSIPIIDLNDPKAVELIAHACSTWGTFQLVNHGVGSTLLDEVEAEARRLFALPLEDKIKALRSKDGATGYGVARIAQFFSKYTWHEGFTIMGSSCVDHAKQLWPLDYERFCDAMDRYQKEMKSLSHKLHFMILKALDISEEEEDMKTLAANSVHDSEGALQLNSYPTCPDPDHAIGLPPHTDSLFFTLLHQSGDAAGLQVFREGFGWVTVSPVTGALVVNVGDLLHILSNGRFPSVYHQAAVNHHQHRISVAYFYGPPVDSPVAPMSKSELPMYRSMMVKEYLSIKAEYLEKALSVIKI